MLPFISGFGTRVRDVPFEPESVHDGKAAAMLPAALITTDRCMKFRLLIVCFLPDIIILSN
jgi:hypothetical protein